MATASGNSEIILQPNTPFYPHAFAAAHGVDGLPLGVRYRCVEAAGSWSVRVPAGATSVTSQPAGADGDCVAGPLAAGPASTVMELKVAAKGTKKVTLPR